MGDTVTISVDDVGPAAVLAQPARSTDWTQRVTALQFGTPGAPAKRGLFGRGGGGGIEVDIWPLPMPDAPLQWSTQVRFGRGADIEVALRRAGVEWPVWWAVGDGEMSVLVPRARMLMFTGFANAHLALPWFVRLNAAATGGEPGAPVQVTVETRRVHDPMQDGTLLGGVIDAYAEERSDELKRAAYEEWQVRAAANGYRRS